MIRRALQILLFILIPVVLAGLTRANYLFALQNPGGSDFLPGWVGGRQLLLNGYSPYGDQVDEIIQDYQYGRPARPDEDAIKFVYPLYSVLVFMPFSMVPDFALARALWMTSLEILLVAIALISLALLKWRLSGISLVFYLLFAIFWYHAARSVINGNIVIYSTFFVVLSLLLMRSDQEFAAGLFLALSSVKPNVMVLFIPFVLLWSYSHRRWQLISSTLGSFGFLVLVTVILIPDWIQQNFMKLISYAKHSTPATPGDVFVAWWPGIGDKMGWALTLVLAILLIAEWRAARQQDFRWFLWTASLTLVITQWIGITTDPGNFIILFLPLIFVFAVWEEHYGRKGRLVALILMFLILFGLWGLFLLTLEYGSQPQQSPFMFFPLPLLLLLGLYWIRWWAIRPVPLFAGSLRVDENL
jgi:hypothetical protein